MFPSASPTETHLAIGVIDHVPKRHERQTHDRFVAIVPVKVVQQKG